tara:strand:- start:900 stop:1172 length:273 start_codon:yes stop_codon:yes gene_type:complete
VVLTTKKMGGAIATQLKKGEFMKYLILTDTVANKEKVKAGDVVELPVDEGRALVGYGKAEEYKGKAKKETNRSVGLEESDAPKPKKRTKK